MTRMQFFNLMRSLHLYISTALFALLVFFCITGITLSHNWYLDDQSSEARMTLDTPDVIAASLQPDSWGPDIEAILEFIRQQAELRSPQNIELDADYGEVILDYKAPAGDAQVIVDAESISIDVRKSSWLAVLNNLHKNRDAGSTWSLLVDISAVSMLLFAVTGFLIVFQNRRKRSRSMWIIAMGTATPIVVFLLFVPKLPSFG